MNVPADGAPVALTAICRSPVKGSAAAIRRAGGLVPSTGFGVTWAAVSPDGSGPATSKVTAPVEPL